MKRFSDLVTKQALAMGCFAPGVAALETGVVRLDSNENPLGPSPRAIEAMRRALGDAHFYPDHNCNTLRTRLAGLHKLSPEQILITAGSTAMISILCRTLLAPGLNAVTSEKSFIVYRMAVCAAGADLIETPTNNEGFDLSAILQAVNDQTRIVLLANPNNPTGTLLHSDELDRFVSKTPRQAVVVLDEAYFDYAAHFARQRKVEYSRGLSYVQHGARVVVLRTFSKAHGLAGLRVGYGIGPAELMSYCARMQETYSVSSIAQAAALAALDDVDHVERSVLHNAEQAPRVSSGLLELGFKIVPTWANFFYCEVGEDAVAVSRRLIEEGVSVRPLGAWGAPTCIRVSVGTAGQNDAFLQAIGKM